MVIGIKESRMVCNPWPRIASESNAERGIERIEMGRREKEGGGGG